MRTVGDFEDHVSALVIGDCMLDRRISGRVERISPEAPVPVVHVEREHCCPGGAGHVAASLTGLGCRTTLAGVVGCDRDGEALRGCLRQNDRFNDELLVHGAATTISKTRIVAGTYQQLARLDYEGPRSALAEGAERAVEQLYRLVASHDVVVLADYDKGTLSDDLLRRLIAKCSDVGVPCIVDGKKRDFSSYARATLLAPNLLEVERAVGRPVRGDDDIARVAEELRERLALDYMIVTRGPEGMTVASGHGTAHIPAKAREVADVTGAGDTVVAVLAACLADGWEIENACALSVLAAGIAVGKPGTYVVGAAELDAAYRGLSPKVVDWSRAKKLVDAARHGTRRIVFTNGCFDILHAGHLSCLERSRELGDFLVVGLNSDASVRALKGPSRPVVSQEYRATLLAGLACVDAVVVFDEETPESLIRHLAPNVLVKGGDYSLEQVVGADIVHSYGGQVVTIPLVPGLSTTTILESQREKR